MNRETAEQYINQLYKHILGRDPRDKEFEDWVWEACSDRSAEEIFYDFVNCEEYLQKTAIKPFFPSGHFYSPIVDPDTTRKLFKESSELGLEDLRGIALDVGDMFAFWKTSLDFIRSTPFTDTKTAANRYYYDNTNYSYGDAIILRATIGHYRPSRIIEIGSGFSSACMLDAADHAAITSLELTCIDPDAERLRSVLLPEDYKRVEIQEIMVQEVPLETFSVLQKNDILFIDSSHVLKTGSDVNHELFNILPQLSSGVLIHFHDIQFPFEYPERWVLAENYSWNEIYAVRAFLMYNEQFEILFWNGLFAHIFRKEISRDFPLYLKNPGGSLWIRKK